MFFFELILRIDEFDIVGPSHGDGTKIPPPLNLHRKIQVTIDDLSWVNPDDLPTGNNFAVTPTRVGGRCD